MLVTTFIVRCVNDLDVVCKDGHRETALQKGRTYEATEHGALLQIRTDKGFFTFEKESLLSSTAVAVH
jgi:hypothetical protein